LAKHALKEKPAEKEEKAPSLILPTIPPRATLQADALLEPILKTLRIMSLEPGSSLAMAEEVGRSRKDFKQAAEAEQALGYTNHPTTFVPVEETVGAAMLASGKLERSENA